MTYEDAVTKATAWATKEGQAARVWRHIGGRPPGTIKPIMAQPNRYVVMIGPRVPRYVWELALVVKPDGVTVPPAPKTVSPAEFAATVFARLSERNPALVARVPALESALTVVIVRLFEQLAADGTKIV